MSGSSDNKASAAGRLQKELMELLMAGAVGISAFPHQDDLFHWVATVCGVAGTPYEGLEYKLAMKFPPSYPYAAPTVTFLTACFHPNVDVHGAICLDILKEKWSPVYSASAVLISIQNLLDNPNNQSPLNLQAARLWGRGEAYRSAVMAMHGSSAT